MPLKTTIYQDSCTIHLMNEGQLLIETPDESLRVDEHNKPVFNNDSGESVIEYTGLSSDGNATRSWAKAIFQPEGASQSHFHEYQTEIYYIFEGTAKVTLNENVHTLSAGESIEVPPHVHHQVDNASLPGISLVLIVKCQPAWSVNDLHFTASAMMRP